MDHPKDSTVKISASGNTAFQPLKVISPLHRATRQISIYFESVIEDLGLAPSEAHLLAYVQNYGPCPVGDLVRVLGHKKSTMTNMLDRMENNGYITRQVNPQDRRSFLISATPEGAEIGSIARERVLATEREIMNRLTARDLKGFTKTIAAIDQVTKIQIRPGRTTP